MSYSMPVKADEKRLYGAVASLECQRCGRNGPSQISHSNQPRDGKAKALKSYPWRIAALCPACHVEIDSGKNLTRQERRDQWDDAHRSTLGELFARGLVRPVDKMPANYEGEYA